MAAVIFGAGCVLAADTVLRSVFEPVIRPRYVVVGTLGASSPCRSHGRSPLPSARATPGHGVGSSSSAPVSSLGDVAVRLSRSPVVELADDVDDDPVDDQPVLGRIRDLPTICDAVGRRPGRRGVFAVASTRGSWTACVACPASVAVDVVPRYYDLMGWQAQRERPRRPHRGEPRRSAGNRRPRPHQRLLDLVGSGIGLARRRSASRRSPHSPSGPRRPGPLLFRQPRLGRDPQRAFRS